MDHNFVFNTLSVPAENAKSAYDLMWSALKGMLAVGAEGDRYVLFCDGATELGSLVLAKNYKYSDFLEALRVNSEEDMLLALLEIDDKTPMLDHIPDEEIEELSSSSFYFPDEGYAGSIDLLAVAWKIDGILLSLGTSPRWLVSELSFAQFSEGVPLDASSFISNVSCKEHGITLRNRGDASTKIDYQGKYSSCSFSKEFLEWSGELPVDLGTRVARKFDLANEKNFQGGKPLFDTLENADGMREMRFSAVQGGAVRILFGALGSGRQAILMGFVKKSDNEGYSDAIKAGKKMWDQLKNQNGAQ